ncbi:MAG: PD40 domain-containing protein [Flavobacteriales bacterium]|nr:PD40 domain-containing protein [Flavobacteriales bacterium]
MKSLLFIVSLFASLVSFSQGPLWMRYPSISPDGSTIAFNYKGDIYLVDAKGGKARAITTHTDHDFMPIWSNDGKQIAFASNRYGNYDIFVMPSGGAAATRLTYHSANDYPHSFDKEGNILFNAGRLDSYLNSQFPSGVLNELYSINETGNLRQVLTTPAESAVWNKDKSKLIYHDRKGYENQWRKHHTSAVTRDIWSYNPVTKEHSQLTDFNGEDRNPVWSVDEKSIYYLSEESGSFNIWKKEFEQNIKTQITTFENHPVRFLSIANTGVLSFGYDGELYIVKEGEEPKKLKITISMDDDFNVTELIDVKGQVSEMTLSPNGKEIAFVARGEIFVTALDYSETKRITNTPEQERNISFSPDGRSILFAGERNESWNFYQVTLEREEEKFFYNATILKEEPIVVTAAETFQPSYSPDGKEVAFLEERVELKVLNIASKETRTVLDKKYNYSYSDGDQSYQWSPDGKWFLVVYLAYNRWNGDIGLASADGKQLINLTESGYECYSPKWVMGGEAIVWFSGRHGMKSHGSWGSESDAYAMFLTQEAFDKFNLTDAEYQLKKEEEKEKEKEEKPEKEKSKDKGTDKKSKEIEPLVFNLENAKDRVSRLTIHSSKLSDAILTKDGAKLYYLSSFEKGFDLWVQDFKKNETKLLSKLGSGYGELKLDEKEKNIIVFSNKKIQKIDAESGKAKAVSYTAKMEWNQQKEFEYIYNHAWRQTLKKFYVVDMHGVDWAFYKKEYAKFLPHINNGQDFAEMLSELLGELNASHTGSGYRFRKEGGDKTASLGVFPDYSYTGKGIKVAEIIDKSPLLINGSEAKTGMIITRINDVEIINLPHYYRLLNNQKDENVLVTYTTKADKEISQVYKPISQRDMYHLSYERYVKMRNEQVEKLSGGKVGYVHVRGMNDESFRQVYSDVLGKHADKDAIIVDTRFNGGGWLHDDLATFLSGKMYATFLPRGQNLGHEPLSKWYRPSAVLIGEGNYSDAHGFPFAYRALDIGKTVGMPVPGTMTAVWWEGQINKNIYFGIPQVGILGLDNKLRENYQFEPDVKVKNDYKSVAEGEDKQLEAAVNLLLKK